MDCEPVRLTVGDWEVIPFHFPGATEIPSNHEAEAKRMIQSMLKAGIIEEVTHPIPRCARRFFVEKPDNIHPDVCQVLLHHHAYGLEPSRRQI